jgi:hypothetical protein
MKKKFVLVFGICCFAAMSKSQVDSIFRKKLDFDSLQLLWGAHKKLPKGGENQALEALSHYEELMGARIKFRYKKAKLPYSARPTIACLIFPFVKRKYLVTVSTQSTKIREPTLFKNLGYAAQVGVLGHELAHVAWFTGRTRGQIILESLHYIGSKTYKSAYEKQTDRIALAHGLGPELYIWCKEVYPIKLKDGDRWKVYYAPEELLELMRKD